MVSFAPIEFPRVFLIVRAKEPAVRALMEAWRPEHQIFGPFPMTVESTPDLSVTFTEGEAVQHFKRFDLIFVVTGQENQPQFCYARSFEAVRAYVRVEYNAELGRMEDFR